MPWTREKNIFGDKIIESWLLIGCLNIYGIHVTANRLTNNVVFFFVSDLKIVYYNNY